jgi:hypothetical protein
MEAGLIDRLFERFGQHLEAKGYIARDRKIIDATIQGRRDARGMGAAARQGCPEGQGRALDKEE